MNRKKVYEMIDKGEGLTIEFKQRFSSYEKIAKEMIAFANTSGGYLLIGVDDDKSIYGIETEKTDVELINETAEKHCEPSLKIFCEVIDLGKNEILVVGISESDRKPHRIQDYKTELDLNTAQVFVRVNDKSVLASKEMIKLIQTQANGKNLKNYVVGSSEKIVFDFLDKHEKITVKELSNHANISERRASRTLIKLVRANLLFIHVKDNGENFFTYSGA